MVRLRDAGRMSYRRNLINSFLGAGELLMRLKRRHRSRAETARSIGTLVDALETRVMLSTLPAPITTFNTNITGVTVKADNTNYSSPSIAYDPADPMKVVEASVENAPGVSGDEKVFIQLSYSTNGGATWTDMSGDVDYNLPDPTTTSSTTVHYYVDATDPTVAFDGLGNFYLAYSEHGTSNASGSIVLDKFNFTYPSGQPNIVFIDNVVYAWSSGTSAVVHPTMAIDADAPSYTSNGYTLTDPTVNAATGQGPVYIGWATDFEIPNAPAGYNPNAIQVIQSDDGGANFGPASYFNAGENAGSERDTYPQLAVSQGTIATDSHGNPLVEPGQLTAVWDDFGTGSQASPTYDLISTNHYDLTSATPETVSETLVSPDVESSWEPLVDAVDLGTSPDTYAVGVNSFTFPLTFPTGFQIQDMAVQIGLSTPNLDGYEIQLIAPDGTTTAELLEQGAGPAGTYPTDAPGGITSTDASITPAQGAQGSYLGEISNLADPAAGILGTTFDGNSNNDIHAGTSPYIGVYGAEGGSLNSVFGGLSSSALSGTWTLNIISYVPDGSSNITPQLSDFKIGFTNAVVANQSTLPGDDYVTGALNAPFPLKDPVSPVMGIGPDPVIASDNSLGTYSPYQGRLYIAFTYENLNTRNAGGTDTNIALYYSTNGGKSWVASTLEVNDDDATTDGYSGSNGGTNDRSQFEPAIAVDQDTGTLVLTWYDARYDAANARVARFITTSIDGGSTFGGQTYLNEPNQVYDAITGQATDLGPIPDNFSAGNSIPEGQYEEGASQGLAVYDGRVFAAWTGNANGGPDGNEALDILTSTTTYAAGPRIISSTQGVVSTPEDIVNPAQNLGGSIGTVPAFQYIDVTFDRPVVPSTFVPGDVDIQYRNDSTPGTAPPTDDISDLVASITPLNLQDWGNSLLPAATEYRIALSEPQTAVGTYSYSVTPSVSDGFLNFGLSNTQSFTFTASDPTTNALTGQTNLVVPQRNSKTTTSEIQIPAGAVPTAQQIVDVVVNVEFDGPIDDLSLFTLTLIAPDGTAVVLAQDELGASESAGAGVDLPSLAGHGYVATTFDDESDEPITDGNFQFSGTYHPVGNLAAFNGESLNSGDTWTLQITSSVENTGNVQTGLLRDWSLQFQTQTLRNWNIVNDLNGDGNTDYAFASGNKLYTYTYDSATGAYDPTVYILDTDDSNALWLQYGDFNGDGINDILAVTDTGQWLLPGTSSGGFLGGIEEFATPSVSQMATGDFNGDGITDVAVINSNKIDIYTGTASGYLSTGHTYSVTGTALSVTAGDFNGDGKIDLLVTTSTGVYLMAGNGNGTFQAATQPIGFGTSTRYTGDLTNDGYNDLIIPSGSKVKVYLNQNGSSFAAPVTYTATPDGSAVTNVVVTDVGNGTEDLLVTSSSGEYVLYGNGDGTFQAPQIYFSANNPDITIADFDGDTHPDFVTLANNEAAVYLSSTAGAPDYDAALAAPVEYQLTTDFSFVRQVAVGNFNGDSYPDILAWTDSGLWGIPGNGDGTFGTPEQILSTANGALLADFDNQNMADFVVINGNNTSVTVYSGASAYATSASYPITTDGSLIDSLKAMDINNDGYKDIVATTNTGLWAITSNGSGGFSAPIHLVNSTNQIFSADLDNDGKPDYVTKDPSGTGVDVYLSSQNYTETDIAATGDGSTITGVSIVDFNLDGKLDIVATSSTGTWVLTGNGDGTFNPVLELVVPGSGAPQIAAADFDGNGTTDIAFIDPTTSNIAVAKNMGYGIFIAPLSNSVEYPSQTDGSTPTSITALDYNDTGAAGLMVVTSSGDWFSAGNGDGTFSAPVEVNTGLSSFASGDFNNDGIPDFAAVDSSGNFDVFIGQGGGVYTETSYNLGEDATSIATGDFNGDGSTDLLVSSADAVWMFPGDGLGDIYPIQISTVVPQTGNVIDQNGDAIAGQLASYATGFQSLGDVWAMPEPSSADSYTNGAPAGTSNYFTAPFTSGTSAIIVPGPSIAQYVNYPASVGSGVSIPSTTTAVYSTLTISVPSYVTISDLLVKLQITYPQATDLVVTLISPAGTRITLAAWPQGTTGAANFGDSMLGPTVFTDDASNSIAGTSSDAPFVGLYKPITPLSNLDGQSLAGTWTLEIQNIGGSGTGTLNSWSISADTQQTPTDLSSGFSQMVVQFDRNMDPNTITNSDVVSLIGPTGPVTNASGQDLTFTIAPDPNYDSDYPDPDPSNPRTYLITFIDPSTGQPYPLFLTGTYTLTLADTIASASYTFNSTQYPSVALDTDQNAGVDMLNDSGGSVKHTYPGSGTDDSATIPPKYQNDGVAESTITVPISDAALIQKLSLTLYLDTASTGGFASDLSAVLIAPDGTAVYLFGGLSSSTQFMGGVGTTFSDAATIPISSGSNGYEGIFNPQQPLSTLINTNSAGTWTLVISNSGTNQYTLDSWSLSITTASPDTGVGFNAGTTTSANGTITPNTQDITPGNQATASFKLFNLGGSDALSHEEWSPVGGTANTGSNSAAGPVTALAVDPSDPSGNTVFIGAATGGVWKTTDFLTTDPAGPTYQPLIANAPTNGLNIGSIAVLGSQVNPFSITSSNPSGTVVPSMIFAATGNGNSSTLSPGIGILVSTDDGVSWNLATGLTNTDSNGNWLPMSSRNAAANTTFEGLVAYKIVVDPHLQANGQAIIYVAFTDPNAAAGTTGKGGLYRSTDSGKTWQLMRAGQATDVLLELNSAIPSFNNADINNPTENVQSIDAAFAGDGVYRSTNQGESWTELLGTNPDAHTLDASTGNDIPVVVSSKPNPDGDYGRIVLAAPALTGNPIEDALYQGWLYAAVVSENNLNVPDGTLIGLYMTKDYGASWTKVQIDGKIINGVVSQNPTNDTTQDQYDVTNGTGISEGVGNYAIALSVDANNPNVVYLASSAYTNYAAGMIRIDTTGISDPHAFYQGENAPDGGQIRANTTDVDALKNWYNSANPDVGAYLNSIDDPTINLLQDPSDPFGTNSTVKTTNIADVSNSGANVTWLPFDEAFDYTNAASTQVVDTVSEYHDMISEVDPLTGLTRLIVATDQGVYSAVDDNGVFLEYDPNGSAQASPANEQNPSGALDVVQGPNGPVYLTMSLNDPLSGSRNGNLQIAELYYGAVQPSQTAANAAGGLFYAEGQGTGLVSSTSNILTSGNTAWKGTPEPSGGGSVATDQTGTGTVYDYANPFWSGTYTDFLQVNGTGRTTGLLTTSADGNVTTHDNEWDDFTESGNLAEGTINGNQSANSNVVVNPINNQQMVISSHPTGDVGAQIFATQNQGYQWTVIGTPADLDDTYAPALAYGAPATNSPEGSFIYAGTDGGHIYVTFNDGGTWTNISSGLDGSQVEAIVADPNHNSFDAYAVTNKGVYYMADSSAANAKWTPITSNLTTLTQTALGNGLYTQTAVQALASLVADWRYATPILYVGANDGVYRGIDNAGTWTWAPFPDVSTDGAPTDGGDLPNVEVSDLDLSTGNVDPTTGIPVDSTGANNILMASTFGDGAYAIRLAPLTFNTILSPASDSGVSDTDNYTQYRTLTFTGSSEETVTLSATSYNAVALSIYLVNSNGTTTFLGGYSPGDMSSDANGFYNTNNQTSGTGTFNVTTNTNILPANGTFKIEVQATDQAGVVGPLSAPITVTIATTPPVISGMTLTAATQTGQTIGGVEYTHTNPPTITGTVTNPASTSQSEAGTVVTIFVDGNSVGTATVGSNNTFTFTLPAALAQGQYTITATATDPVGNTSVSPASLTIDIITSISTPAAPTLTAASDSGTKGDNITNVPNPTFSGTASPNDTITLYSNGVADGITTADSSGNYTIPVANPLGADGAYAITVTQTDYADNISPASPALTVTLDTTPPAVVADAISAHQYGSFDGTVGTVTDLHPDGSTLPEINWGDGTSSQGTLETTSNPDVDNVEGMHVYTATGTFNITITATDAAGNSNTSPSSGSGAGSITVTPPAPAVTAINISDNEGSALTNVPVASFSNGAPGATAGEFSATINWGDGAATEQGTIIPDPNNSGSFLVEGNHTYADGPNTYTTTISVTETGIAAPTVATGTATVANVPPTVTLGGTTTGFINQIIQLPITATDPSAADTAAGFTYLIQWGDGATQTITPTANNGTGQSPTHAYTAAGNYTISVTATDKDGGASTTSETMQIAAAPALSNVVVNGGQTQRSHITTISFTLSSTTVPITTLDTTDLALVFDGQTNVPLTNATVTYNAATGQATVNLQNVPLANGDYQLFVFPGTGVLPINFTKLTGDVDGDGFVTKTDQKIVKADMGAKVGQANYNPNADVNGDGVVNATDLDLLQLDKTKKMTTKVIKLQAGKVIKPVSVSFPSMATNFTRAVPIQLVLENTDPSRPLTVTDVSLLGGGANFSFAVMNQTYGQTTFTIPAGGTLAIRLYFTPTGPGKFTTQLKAQLSNDVQATYGAVIAKISAKATAPKIKK